MPNLACKDMYGLVMRHFLCDTSACCASIEQMRRRVQCVNDSDVWHLALLNDDGRHRIYKWFFVSGIREIQLKRINNGAIGEHFRGIDR